jgi:hypothetical protein
MTEPNITCPKCGADIALTDAVCHSLREDMEADFEQRRAELNQGLQKREEQLAAEAAALKQRAESVQAQVDTALAAERQKLKQQAVQEAESRLGLRMTELQAQVADQAVRLKEAQEAELTLRRQKRELEEARQAMELEVERKLDTERQRIADAARQQTLESERLKMADKEQMIKGLQDQIALLQQRAAQGSMQLQGETLELDLENQLRTAFPSDEVGEIKKGQRGADVMQRVRAGGGIECGAILWEAKRARNWSGDWPEKLREDQREAKAELAVIVTTCPPQGLRGIGMVEGVWVCEPPFATPLAAALRQGLVSTAAQRIQQANRADKMASLYDYLCGVEFRQHMEALVESFMGLRDQLLAEQRAYARQWKEREAQIEKAITHAAMLYGGIQGIAGREALPTIAALSLPGGNGA